MLIVLVTLILASPGLAAEGMLEINQACAVGGCFPGDSPGFPVTLSTAGSYHLTSNLTVPAATTAIEIATGHVTLDLEGFLIKGPNVCSGYPVSGCTSTAGASGIHAATANEFLAVVRNGSVTGFAGDCVSLNGNSSTVDRISAFYCGANGIRVGFAGIVRQSHSSNNFETGLFIGDAGMAEGNEARGNRSSGIVVNATQFGVTLVGNRLMQNNSLGNLGSFGGGTVLVSKNYIGNLSALAFAYINEASVGDNLCINVLC